MLGVFTEPMNVPSHFMLKWHDTTTDISYYIGKKEAPKMLDRFTLNTGYFDFFNATSLATNSKKVFTKIQFRLIFH